MLLSASFFAILWHMANSVQAQPEYFTKVEASSYLRFSPRTLESFVARGELQAFRPCRKLLFRREDLDTFVQRYPVNVSPDNSGQVSAE